MKKLALVLACQLMVIGSSLADWNAMSALNTARDQFAGGVIGDALYVFGGNGNPDGVNLGTGERYDIAADTWSAIAANPHAGPYGGIEELTGVGLNGKFYVFGGWGGESPDGYYGVTNFNEVYDPASDSWSSLALKPTTAASVTPAVYGGKIYLFGGYFEDENPNGQRTDHTVVEAYDPAADAWAYVTDMPVYLMGPAIAVHGDSAYVIGGFDPAAGAMNTEVMAYHFVSNTWTRNYCVLGSEAARVYSYASTTPVVDGKAYLIGGIEGTQVSHRASDRWTVFDIAAKTAESREALPQAREGHFVAVHNGVPYVVGGYDDEEDLYRSQDTVYAALPASSDLSGEYWFCSLSADATTHAPLARRGTLSIAGTQWSLEWEDAGGAHTFSSEFTTSALPDGSINIHFPGGDYNAASNGDVLIHAGTVLGGGGEGIDFFVRKAVDPQAEDIVGEYRLFGHQLNTIEAGDSCEWGNLVIDPNGTLQIDYTNDQGAVETGAMHWTFDETNGKLCVYESDPEDAEPAVVGRGGILAACQVLPEEGQGGDLGYNVFIRKTDAAMTLAQIAGTYQVRFLETGPGGVPYTCGEGTCVIGADGTMSVNATYSNGEQDSFTTVCHVGPGNAFHLDDDAVPEGIVNPDGNLIFLPECGYEDPANRTEDDWLGGLFLVRQAEPEPAAFVELFWQVVHTVFPTGPAYSQSIRVISEDLQGCALKGPGMADFTPASWDGGLQNWLWERYNLSFADLRQASVGTWQLKLLHADGGESVVSFDISGLEQEREFLPIPTILEPAAGDAAVIAEHYTMRWNPNGDLSGAHDLYLEIGGNGFNYFSSVVDLSTTSWKPGWLELGEAYAKVGYVRYRPDMIGTPTVVSGPGVDWGRIIASLVSGDKHYFTVKYSLDLFKDGHVGLADLAEFASRWMDADFSEANFDDGDRVGFEDFDILAQHWDEGAADAADHVYNIEIETHWDYEAPGAASDTVYEFEMTVMTDDAVVGVEVTTPAGKTFAISNRPRTEYAVEGGWMEIGMDYNPWFGQYEWYYGPSFADSAALDDYGDGLYTLTLHLAGGRVAQTTAWFGIPGTTDPIPQPTQLPVFTSFDSGDTLSSPMTFTWEACEDPAAALVWLGVDNVETGEELEYFLATDATGLAEPLHLAPGEYEAELGFEVWHYSENSDGIRIEVGKFSESDYFFTVADLPEGPVGMAWVSVDDSGEGMVDRFGVPISKGGFTGYMSKYETTTAQYCEFLNAAMAEGLLSVVGTSVYNLSESEIYCTLAGGSPSQITYADGVFSPIVRNGLSMADHPMGCVSVYGAEAFAAYYGYRLPTEWEWQAVVDYDGSYVYGCGTAISWALANYYDGAHANPLGLTTHPYSSPVGYYPAAGYGVCDMAGNVSEWTVGDSGVIIRGGSWATNDADCKVSYRGTGLSADRCIEHIGFRVCR